MDDPFHWEAPHLAHSSQLLCSRSPSHRRRGRELPGRVSACAQGVRERESSLTRVAAARRPGRAVPPALASMQRGARRRADLGRRCSVALRLRGRPEPQEELRGELVEIVRPGLVREQRSRRGSPCDLDRAGATRRVPGWCRLGRRPASSALVDPKESLPGQRGFQRTPSDIDGPLADGHLSRAR